MIEKLKNRIGKRLKGLTLYVDVIDMCPLSCPTCPTGVQGRRPEIMMSPGTYKRILEKATSECKIRKVQLYRFGEPLLHPDLHEFIEIGHKYGIKSSISTTLQVVYANMEKVIEARPSEFRISYSGKEMHRYQRGSKLGRFLENLHKLDRLPRYSETRWVMFFHIYKDNFDEIAPAKELAKEYGYDFVPFPATFMVYDHIIEGYTEKDLKTLAMLTETPEENITRLAKKPSPKDYCNMQEGEIILDAKGQMYLCQLMYKPKYIVGDFLTTPLKDLRKIIMKAPMCLKCKEMGIGKYSLIFGDPSFVRDPVKKADKRKYQRY